MDSPVPQTSARGMRHLGRSYALGLTLIAALGIAAAGIVSVHAATERTSALRTNLAGRQRMLTQRVITEAFRAASAGTRGTAAHEHAVAALTLGVSKWNTAFDALRYGSLLEGLPPMLADDAPELDGMQPLRTQLVLAAASLATSSGARTLPALADSVNASGTLLIARLDTYVRTLDTRHRRSVQATQYIAAGFTCLLLLLLAAEARFVFQPATRAIGQLIHDQEAVRVELYAKAEMMYQYSVQQEIQNETLQTQRQTLLDQQEELMAQQSTLIEHRDHLEQRATELSRLTAILDAMPDAVAVFALSGEVLYTNAAAEQHTHHMRKRNWTHAAHLLTPESVRHLRDVAFPRAIRRGISQGEARLRRRDGVDRIVMQTLLAHRASGGRVASVTVMLQDITEQKTLQAKLAADEARTRSIVEALAEGVIVQDGNGQIIQWNAGAERILGLTADQLEGRTSMDASWHATDAQGAMLPSERHPISRARAEGLSIDGEVMGVHRGDGSLAWLSVNARPVPNGGLSDQAAAVATFTDITASLAAARELETLSLVARQSDHAILMLDRTGHATWVNAAWESLSGYTLADVIGRCPGTLLHGTHTRPEDMTGLAAAISSGERWRGELLNYRKDGRPYWIELTVTPTRRGDNSSTGFVVLSRDITARRNADRERQQLAAAVAVTADGIAITDVSGALEFVNQAFARMHGNTVTEMLHTPWAALYEPVEAQRLVREAMPEVTQVGFWQGEATGRHHDGSPYPQELSLTLLPHGGLVALARDITERKASEEWLKYLSLRDELTALYNRRGFLEQADTTLRLSARQGVPCALLYGDLDSFKSINDGFGHDAGDAALQTMAGLLNTTFRETDLLARLGGDEFTMLLIDVRPEDVSLLLERLDNAVTASNFERRDDAQTAWHLGISLGAAYFDPDTPTDVEVLLRNADEAQYVEKHRRKALRAEAA